MYLMNELFIGDYTNRCVLRLSQRPTDKRHS